MAYNFLFILFSFFFISCSHKTEQKLLVERKYGDKISLLLDDSSLYSPDNPGSSYTFFLEVRKFDEDKKIRLISELLSYEGNLTKSLLPIFNLNKNLSNFYKGSTTHATVETEALYLINQVYFDNPFYYAPYPILVDTSGGELTGNSVAMKKVYTLYKSWFAEVNKFGLNEMKMKKRRRPLEDSECSWLDGVDIGPDQPLQFDVE